MSDHRLDLPTLRSQIVAQISAWQRSPESLKQLSDFVERLRPLFSEIKNFADKFGDIADAIQRQWIDKFPQFEQVIIDLSDECWFISPYLGMHDLYAVLQNVEAHPDQTDAFLTKFFTENFDELIRYVCADSSHRARIIQQACEAHKSGQFFLSVPVFFAQADGFCYDIRRCLFDGKWNSPEKVKSKPDQRLHIRYDAEALLSDVGDVSIDQLMLPALQNDLKIAMSEAEREKNSYVGLNRHTVLHGEDTQYGTEINSLKAFSFMVYVAGIVSFYKEEMVSAPTTRDNVE